MLAIADPSGEKRKVVCSIWDNVAKRLSNVELDGARVPREDLAHKDWDDQVLVVDELPMIEGSSSPVSSVGTQQAPLALNQKVLQPVPAVKLKQAAAAATLAADTPVKLADKVPPAGRQGPASRGAIAGGLRDRPRRERQDTQGPPSQHRLRVCVCVCVILCTKEW